MRGVTGAGRCTAEAGIPCLLYDGAKLGTLIDDTFLNFYRSIISCVDSNVFRMRYSGTD